MAGRLSGVVAIGVMSVAWLTGCPAAPRGTGPRSGSPVAQAPLGQSGSLEVVRHEGQPYDIASADSLLTILAFRGGALAKAGHNHVIAAHDLAGTIYVPDDLTRTTFELHFLVAELTIDEPQLRAQEGTDFPPDVPDSAKEGTRRNMLSEALLNGAQYPDITIAGGPLEGHATAGSGDSQAQVRVTVRGQLHRLSVPLHYELQNGRVIVSGELPIKQSDLGLTPFSAMLGALQVQDELRVRFRIVARHGDH